MAVLGPAVLEVEQVRAERRGRLTGLAGARRLDIGIALDALAFDVMPDGSIVYSEPGTQLISFVLHLFERLQAIGTALAIEIDKYEAHIVHAVAPSTPARGQT